MCTHNFRQQRMTGQGPIQAACTPRLMTRRSVFLDHEPRSSGRESAPCRTLPSAKKAFGKEKVKLFDASTTYADALAACRLPFGVNPGNPATGKKLKTYRFCSVLFSLSPLRPTPHSTFGMPHRFPARPQSGCHLVPKSAKRCQTVPDRLTMKISFSVALGSIW
jgi:hypothetical protein